MSSVGAATTFFNDLFTAVETQTGAITGQMTNLINITMPAFQAVFIVYCMFVIWSYWENESSIQGTFIDLMKRIAAWGIILGFGMNIGAYMGTVMPLVRDLGKDLAGAYSGQKATATQLDDLVNKIIKITEDNDKAVNEANAESNEAAISGEVPATDVPTEDKGIIGTVKETLSDLTAGAMESMFGGLTDSIWVMIQNALIWVFSGSYLAVAGAFMLVAQIILSLLAAIGPIFFGLALFPATRGYFTNWVGSVLNYGFFFLFVNIMAHFSIGIVDKQMDVFAANGGSGGMAIGVVLSVVCLFVVFIVVLLQLPQLSSSLFGGVAAGGFSVANTMRRAALSTAGGAAGMAKSLGKTGVNAGVTVGKAGVNAGKWAAQKLGFNENTMKPENQGK